VGDPKIGNPLGKYRQARHEARKAGPIGKELVERCGLRHTAAFFDREVDLSLFRAAGVIRMDELTQTEQTVCFASVIVSCGL
jgi:hypothetical protein